MLIAAMIVIVVGLATGLVVVLSGREDPGATQALIDTDATLSPAGPFPTPAASDGPSPTTMPPTTCPPMTWPPTTWPPTTRPLTTRPPMTLPPTTRLALR